jgi:hypothetical protein
MNTCDFIAAIAPYAQAEMKRSGVLASITLAQGALESAWGRSAPGNNLFGIKGSGQQQTTKEFINGQWITIVDGFCVYDDWGGSIRDHSDFLTENHRYTKAGFFEACSRLDYVMAAKALQTAGYATDPQYAAKLIAIIEQHSLNDYDTEVIRILDDIKQQLADLTSAVEAINKRLEDIDAKLSTNEAPAWFTDEFGPNPLGDLLDNKTGDNDFWRVIAVQLRLEKKNHAGKK